jgi:CxxC motif-containing protein (DUF1111 family)
MRLFSVLLLMAGTAYGQIGAPVAGLTAVQQAQFQVALAEFQQVEAISEGIGPIFNNQSCVACHNNAAVGGASTVTETRYMNAFQASDLLHQSSIVPSFNGFNIQDQVPPDATVVAHRKATALFGMGLIEAITDADIKANVHTPKTVDGVTGTVAIVNDPTAGQNGTPNINTVGRFGWKCQEASLLGFAADAYLNEMGVTTRIPGFDKDIAPSGSVTGQRNQSALLAVEPALTGFAFDQLQDKENGGPPQSDGHTANIDEFADFMRMLAPPPPLPLTAQAQLGQQLFSTVNCVACHKASMTTTASNIQALGFKNVPLYSDLLLHDMASLGDGIVQAAAGPTFMRTAPLWGLRFRTPFLHDGRAATIPAAILAHDGEGAVIRTKFAALPATDQAALIAFLESI